MTKLPDDAKQLEFAGHFAERFPTLAGKKEPSPRLARRVEQAAQVLDAKQGLAPSSKVFVPRDFVLFGLPHKRVPGGAYVRQSGNTTFKILGDPALGVPFGQDRLIGIFLATAAT